MLVLTRRKGQAIRIGEDIRIVVTRIDDGQVRLGLETPSGISILREELFEAVRSDNQDAAQSQPGQLEVWLAEHGSGQTQENS
ncbi:carbon storage regulator [Acidithiobacillus sp. CV18-2]|uniref:Translational regulator CsrA n=1 Tax=Igneacidithiobacillus copahuensis TaxID=2724909 RepID=A0AAE3CJ51_9PROT|nr:carbon storage regulator [Igneacidithiobacillus copahuensis]MBU2754415.1 carbon storage regulator [Acidithiobacillus sp. CV18-3]MBU2757562.1 carbon storage regulator [Acidithiobacillus sp. BN09-2]MBU2777123.1 carbon storage regulator [Acidithiobacillus sp. CV18-2]MBU2797436.1 carbon storage regulator [Acidithiobacillus sp. VAN18-2]MBU2799726.1 carbon storage regulator [Acidithiobacillus sp. VAN18-4]UTV81893.1 carbon storage regulator [Acidithiobacillus sp. YTS05]